MHVYETHKMDDPRLPFIFHETQRTSGSSASVYNWHENPEIIYVTAGSGYITDGEHQLYAEEGDVVVINPHQMHSFAAAERGIRYYCLIIDRSFFMANHFDSNNFFFKEKLRDPEIAEKILCFEKYWRADKSEEPMRVQHLRATALSLMLLLCERYAVFAKSPRTESRLLSCVKKAIGYIRAEGQRDISLDEIADRVGLSKYYFAREFRRITGYSFVGYLNVVRCERAKELLAGDGMSVGEVGRACGFANQSYFTRTFRAQTGLTPGAYRKEKGGE